MIRARPFGSHAAGFAWLIVVGLGLGSCAGPGPEAAGPEPGLGSPGLGSPGLGLPGLDTRGVFDASGEPEPPVYTISRSEYTAALPDTFASSLPGLEVLSWVTADPGGRVGAVLEDLLADSQHLPAAEAAELSRWARSGLRVRVIPLAELSRLVGALVPAGSLNRRAWGTVPQWQPAITASERVDRMRIHDGSIDRDPGSTPRLLLRGWVEPVIEPGSGGGGGVALARVRAELVPQFYAPARAAFEPVASLRRAADEGTVLRELTLSMVLEPGTALVVTAEPGGDEESPVGVGPPTPRVRSLGSALFVDQPEEPELRAGPRPSRVAVLVLVPVVSADAGPGERR
ncbi:MAG: hypothetical protein ACI89L_002259 [Phycisphaerales bacterium]|jgi:hypothetical protein